MATLLCMFEAEKECRSESLKCVRRRFTICVVSNFHPKNSERMNEMRKKEFIQISALYGESYFKFCRRRHFIWYKVYFVYQIYNGCLRLTCHVVVEIGVFTVTYCICWIWLATGALSAVLVIEENHWTFIWSVSFCEKTCYQCFKMARKHMRNMKALKSHGHMCRHHSSISVYLGVHEMM